MKFTTRLRYFFRKLFHVKMIKIDAKPYKEKSKPKNNYKIDNEVSKAMANTSRDDERAIEKIKIRQLHKCENDYLCRQLNSHLVTITRENYKKYYFATTIYKNKVYSAISLYKITYGRRTDYKYILIYQHTKNSDPKAKLRLKYKFIVDFTDVPYHGHYSRLLINKNFREKIWKKVRKLYDEQQYIRHNKI